MKRLDAKMTSEGLSGLKLMKQMEREIGNLHAQCKMLSLASETMVECKWSIATLTEQLKKDRMDSYNTHALNHASSSLRDLVACRWLLENLPVPSGKQKGFGIQWLLFWQLQWDQYDDSVKSGKHPLWKLKGDERYNGVGRISMAHLVLYCTVAVICVMFHCTQMFIQWSRPSAPSNITRITGSASRRKEVDG